MTRDPADDAARNDADECSGAASLVVVADPSIAPAVRTVADRFDAARQGCASTTVRGQSSSDTAADFAARANNDVDVWVPQSSVWLERTSLRAKRLGLPAPRLDAGAVIATSPLVLAAPSASADRVDAATWGGVLAGTPRAVIVDPDVSSVSLAGLSSLAAAAGKADPSRLTAVMSGLSDTATPTPEAAAAAAGAAPEPTVAVTTEQAVISTNEDAGTRRIRAIYPADGTAAVDYPVVRVVSGRKPTVGAFETALQAAGPTFASAGYRGPDGTGTVDAPGAPREAPATTRVPESQQLELLDTWTALTTPSRALLVADVSGSMAEPIGNGRRRIDLFQEATSPSEGGAAKETGLWAFSTRRQGNQDWERLVPVAPESDPAQGARLGRGFASLPGLIGGGTGLYDTILAARNRMRETYDPAKINTVVVFTDGRNDDEDGISLPVLLDALRATADPRRPVPVVFIGVGPDTDVQVMQQIADITGGSVLSADPSD